MEIHADNLEDVGGTLGLWPSSFDFKAATTPVLQFWDDLKNELSTYVTTRGAGVSERLRLALPSKILLSDPKVLLAKGAQGQVLGDAGVSDKDAITKLVRTAADVRKILAATYQWAPCAEISKHLAAMKVLIRDGRIAAGVQYGLQQYLTIMASTACGTEKGEMAATTVKAWKDHNLLPLIPGYLKDWMLTRASQAKQDG